MKKETWAWTIGALLFAGIVGVWVWQLPKVLERAGQGSNAGLTAILSGFGGTGKILNSGLDTAQSKFEKNLKNFSDIIQTQAVQASAIDAVKKKIESQAAPVPGNVPAGVANVNANVNAALPSSGGALSNKKPVKK